MFLLRQGLAAMSLAAVSVKSMPFNQGGDGELLFFDPVDLGQTTTETGPPMDFGLTDTFFGSSLPVDDNTNLLAQTVEPVDFGTTFPLPLEENQNLIALGQDFQPIAPEPIFFSDSGNGFSLPELNVDLLAVSMSCPNGGSLFCCPNQNDANCIPSKSFIRCSHTRFHSTRVMGLIFAGRAEPCMV